MTADTITIDRYRSCPRCGGFVQPSPYVNAATTHPPDTWPYICVRWWCDGKVYVPDVQYRPYP